MQRLWLMVVDHSLRFVLMDYGIWSRLRKRAGWGWRRRGEGLLGMSLGFGVQGVVVRFVGFGGLPSGFLFFLV